MKQIIFFLSFLILTLSCSLLVESETNFEINTTKYPVLDSIHNDITKGDYGGFIDHFLVIHKGEVIADHHYPHDYGAVYASYEHDTTNHPYNFDHTDWYPYYKNTDLHTLQSATKSVTSLLLGIAIDEGLISGVDEKIMPYFDDYDIDWSDERKRNITIKDLLNMSSGLKWDEDYNSEESNSSILYTCENWIEYILNQPMSMEPGKHFYYNSGETVLLGKIINMVTGKRLDEWANEKLFGPIGISNYHWTRNVNDDFDAQAGLYLSALDFAKLGTLVLHKGKWNEKIIVSEKWLNESVNNLISNVDDDTHYGYQWWFPREIKNQGVIYAMGGYGGQVLMVCPKYDLVVVFYGWDYAEDQIDTERYTWYALQYDILPNFIKEQKLESEN
ncbi:MAG: serine hydrolase [Crocinitomicaceae bacterium]|nr:serine hydrolase [Crocinitomicaceae bacterium]